MDAELLLSLLIYAAVGVVPVVLNYRFSKKISKPKPEGGEKASEAGQRPSTVIVVVPAESLGEKRLGELIDEARLDALLPAGVRRDEASAEA